MIQLQQLPLHRRRLACDIALKAMHTKFRQNRTAHSACHLQWHGSISYTCSTASCIPRSQGCVRFPPERIQTPNFLPIDDHQRDRMSATQAISSSGDTQVSPRVVVSLKISSKRSLRLLQDICLTLYGRHQVRRLRNSQTKAKILCKAICRRKFKENEERSHV